jgi:hypothetical protein
MSLSDDLLHALHSAHEKCLEVKNPGLDDLHQIIGILREERSREFLDAGDDIQNHLTEADEEWSAGADQCRTAVDSLKEYEKEVFARGRGAKQLARAGRAAAKVAILVADSLPEGTVDAARVAVLRRIADTDTIEGINREQVRDLSANLRDPNFWTAAGAAAGVAFFSTLAGRGVGHVLQVADNPTRRGTETVLNKLINDGRYEREQRRRVYQRYYNDGTAAFVPPSLNEKFFKKLLDVANELPLARKLSATWLENKIGEARFIATGSRDQGTARRITLYAGLAVLFAPIAVGSAPVSIPLAVGIAMTTAVVKELAIRTADLSAERLAPTQ